VPEPRSPKPYRVYRGGRASRNDPEAARFRFGPDAGAAQLERERPRTRTPAGMAAPSMGAPPRTRLPGREVGRLGEPPPPAAAPNRRFRIGWVRGILIALVVVLVVSGAWAYLGYRAFANEVEKANKRVTPRTRAALAPSDRILFNPQISLIIGSDKRTTSVASGERADSILLLRTDPDAHTISLLSIPRDLRVPVPGVGDAKINSAFAAGGAPLLIRTVNGLTGFRINHIVQVNFSGFQQLVDALGGVDVQNPTLIHSSRPFDGVKWNFERGKIHLDGRRALAYARIRYTTNPADSDISRTVRQQRVLQAIARDLVSPSSLLHLPSVGEAIAKPLATDLSANELIGLGWVKFRASRELECHLGGTPASVGGEAVLLSSERNPAVVDMFLGKSAPQPPPRGELFGAGCTVS
jgi:LCP family protein required for cell wall assembly